MSKKILSSLLAAVLVISSTTAVFAQETSNAGQIEVPVSVDATSNYTVSLPATIQLEQQEDGTYTATKQIGVKGILLESAAVKVVPETTVTLSCTSDEELPDVVASVTQIDNTWTPKLLTAHADVRDYKYDTETTYMNANMTIDANGLSDGTYEGKLNYDIQYNEKYKEAGLYDHDTGLQTATWQQLIDGGVIEVSNDSDESYIYCVDKDITGDLIIADGINGTNTHSAGYNVTGAFANCTKLTSVVIPSSLVKHVFREQSVDAGTFYKCTSLESVTINASWTTIAMGEFCGCTSLKEVNIPDTVTTINAFAFSGCTSLENLYIPNSVTTISDSAFKSVPHITYYGAASGSPWGALAIN